jgi:20S proteasome subunit alpha 2
MTWLVRTLLLLSTAVLPVCFGSDPMDGRYSFSLTTFNPSGKLGQVERAIVASSLGTPIVAVAQGQRILLASPQILPSPFMEDDGTARFSSVAPHIAIAHSGISADGRVLVAAAQRLAVEHAYTFEEPIPIELLLEELSLLFQEYTMKPASRPFGATLLVAHVSPVTGESQLFRIDPSGSVQAYTEKYAIVNGKSLENDMETKLKELVNAGGEEGDGTTLEQRRQELSQLLEEAIRPKSAKVKDEEKVSLSTRIISASLENKSGLMVERRTC